MSVQTIAFSQQNNLPFDSDSKKNTLFSIVNRTLRQQPCTNHGLNYQYFHKNTLMCPQCLTQSLRDQSSSQASIPSSILQYSCSLKNILNHPIVLQIPIQQLKNCNIQLFSHLLNSYKCLYPKKTDLLIQKQKLIAFLNSLQNKIKQLSQTILQRFEQFQQNIDRQSILREEMIVLNAIYQRQLQETLSQNWQPSTPQQLQALLTQIVQNGQSPFEKMQANLEEMVGCVLNTPIINTQKLKEIYTTVTDETIWSCEKIIFSQKESMYKQYQATSNLISNQNIQLQNTYTLQHMQDSLILKKKHSDKILGKLDQHYDSLYALSKYKILGINYQEVHVISYFQELNVQHKYNVKACTDALIFDDYLVLISQGKLLRIDLFTHSQEILCQDDYNDLKFVQNSPYSFESVNSQGETKRWNVRDKTLQYPYQSNRNML